MGTMLRIACRIYLRGVKVRNSLFIFLGRFLPFAPLKYIRGSRLPTHNINSRLLYGCPTTFYGGLVWIWLMMMADALRMSLLVPLMTLMTRILLTEVAMQIVLMTRMTRILLTEVAMHRTRYESCLWLLISTTIHYKSVGGP